MSALNERTDVHRVLILEKRIQELENAMRDMARGRKLCASGDQRISRDEMKNIARDYCTKYGITW